MIKAFVFSLQFLTRLPIKLELEFSQEMIKKSIFFYPFVGLILGGLSAIPYYFLSSYSVEVASLLSLLLMIILSGGLHLDGLADSADGFFANKGKEETLEIMRDSRIGAFGVLSLIIIILSKYVLLTNLGSNLPLYLALSMANGRLIAGLMISLKDVARSDGLGYSFQQGQPKSYSLMSLFLYGLLLALMDMNYLFPLIIAYFTGQFIAAWAKKKLGGFTGDLYGATIEICELLSLLVFCGGRLWI